MATKMSKLLREITDDSGHVERISRGVATAYRVAKAAYGPGASNVIIELPYGDPTVSRDGATNLKRVRLPDALENAAFQIIRQASDKNNMKVGDGTTAVAILAYHLYQDARKLIAAGKNRMQVAKLLKDTAVEVLAQLDAMKITVDDKTLQHVAKISAGDEAIGQMIADVIGKVGLDGGVTVEDFPGVGIYSDLVDGFYFRKGFTNVNLINDPTNLESRHTNADILLSEKRLNTTADIAPILDKIIAHSGTGKELVLIGDVSEEVLGLLLLNRLKGIVNVTVVDLPVYGAIRSLTFEDLALVTGGKVYTPGANASDFELSMLGGAAKIIINEFSTTIIGGEGGHDEVAKRCAELREQKSTADSTVAVEALNTRLAHLTGKVAIIRVGGATQVEQGEVKLRVQDAICAVQAAIQDGIVPGGGVALARVETKHFQDAFRQPFMCLVENCGYNKEQALWRLLKTRKVSKWYGYDLRDPRFNYVPCNTLQSGIVDPASVVKETVRNATSVVAQLITAGLGLMLLNREDKND